MKIEKKNGELEDILENLKKAMEEKTPLPPRVSYATVKNKLALEQALEAYHKSKDDIINAHSNGKGHISSVENPTAFAEVNAEIAVISKELTEVDIATIKLSELGERELPLNLVVALGFMITEE